LTKSPSCDLILLIQAQNRIVRLFPGYRAALADCCSEPSLTSKEKCEAFTKHYRVTGSVATAATEVCHPDGDFVCMALQLSRK
jgi:hypothetical protein